MLILLQIQIVFLCITIIYMLKKKDSKLLEHMKQILRIEEYTYVPPWGNILKEKF